MELDSLNNIREARTIKHELTKHWVIRVAEGQNELRDGRDILGVLEGELDKFVTDRSESRAGLEDVYYEPCVSIPHI